MSGAWMRGWVLFAMRGFGHWTRRTWHSQVFRWVLVLACGTLACDRALHLTGVAVNVDNQNTVSVSYEPPAVEEGGGWVAPPIISDHPNPATPKDWTVGNEELAPRLRVGQEFGAFRVDRFECRDAVVEAGSDFLVDFNFSHLPGAPNKNAEMLIDAFPEWDWTRGSNLYAKVVGEPRSITTAFSLVAPKTPGQWRVRVWVAWANEHIPSFGGGGPPGPSGWPGVSPYLELTVTVKDAPVDKRRASR